jgi:hypothetical protein
VTLDKQQVECLARAALTAALTADGLEVARPERDAGIDLLAYTINPLREASDVVDAGGWSWDSRGRYARTQVTGDLLLAVQRHRVLPGQWKQTLLG